MTQFMSKSFSVAMGLNEKGRANYDRIFRKPRRRRKGEKSDTARVQEAFDKAAETGGGVYLPAGTYRISGAAKKPKPKKGSK